MLQTSNLENTKLLECPGADFLGKSSVDGRGGRGSKLLDGSIEPLVLEHFGRTEDGEAGRVASLEGGDKGELGSNGKEIVDRLGIILGVVRVGGGWGSQDRGEQRACVSEHLTNSARHGEEAVDGEVVLDTRLE